MDLKFVVCNGVSYLCELSEPGDGKVYLFNAYLFEGNQPIKGVLTEFLKNKERGLLQSVTVSGQFACSVTNLDKEQLLLFRELDAKMEQARINALPCLVVEKFEKTLASK